MAEFFDYRREQVKQELDKIHTAWDHFFLEYSFCKRRMSFPRGMTHSYVGEIIGNFTDTFDVIYGKRRRGTFTDEYSGKMSLMQSIYVQQDFIEEMLWIFKCGIDKSHLKLDENYSINRDLRNELFGHPIRKKDGELISTTLIAYNGEKGSITYMKYHKDNDYDFQSVSHEIDDIIERHTKFLQFYFNKILTRQEEVLGEYKAKLIQLEVMMGNPNVSFEQILNYMSKYFETIFKYGYLYEKEKILTVYRLREKHQRYATLVDTFLKDVRESVDGFIELIHDIFNPPEKPDFVKEVVPLLNILEDGTIEIVGNGERIEPQNESKVSYHYELGKLATNRDLFDMCYNVLGDKCSENQLVLEELDHMKMNQLDETEYYSALNLIRVELNEI